MNNKLLAALYSIDASMMDKVKSYSVMDRHTLKLVLRNGMKLIFRYHTANYWMLCSETYYNN